MAQPGDTRTSFHDAVDSFLATAELIEPERWRQPATDEWSVLELFSHIARGLSVISDYLDVDLGPSPEVTVDGPANYFRLALAAEGVHLGIRDRAVSASERYRDDPLAAAREVASSVTARVDVTEDDRPMKVFVETMRFIDYLHTRIVELVLHTFDLQLACGLSLRAPESSLAVVEEILIELTDRADPRAVVLALSGRSSGLACNVLH